MPKFIISFGLLLDVGCSGNSEASKIDKIKDPVVYGWEVEPSEYPSVVALANYDGPFCSGTLIKPDLVITAAHCIVSPTEVAIAHNMKDPVVPPLHWYPVADTIINPNYEPFKDQDVNDIGLVVLQKPIPDAIVSPILLPDRYAHLKHGQELTIVGYGRNIPYDPEEEQQAVDAGQKIAGVLRAGTAVVVDRTEFEIHFYGTNEACHGDSGGPAYIEIGGVRYVTGVTSRGIAYPICETGSIYSLPGSYFPWIEKAYADSIVNRVDFPESPEPPVPPEPEEPFDAGPDVSVESGTTLPAVVEPTGSGCNYSNGITNYSWLGFFGILISFAIRRKSS